MSTPPDNWDQEERAALQPLLDELRSLRERHADDPTLDLLRAAKADALPGDLQATAHAHLEDRWNQVLVDSANAASGGLNPEDETRLLDRVNREARSSVGWRFWRPGILSLVAVSALVVIAVAIVKRTSAPLVSTATGVPAATPAATPVPTAPHFLVPLGKPDVKLSPNVLTYRGDVAGTDLVSRLKPALDAYRLNDYARANRELTALAVQYPRAVEVHFYQGIARLFLHDFAGADQSLSAAERIGEPSFADDISWYRAVVDERLGRPADARARLKGLCVQVNHARQTAACDAAEKLR